MIVSDDPSSAIGVRVADCAPILLADRRVGVVGAAHAGWRGTVQGAAAAAVARCPRVRLGPAGPGRGDRAVPRPCCGEVGPEVVDAFRVAGHGADWIDRWFQTPAPPAVRISIWRANADQLDPCGCSGRHVHVAGLCTKTHADVLHSYRAEGEKSGRMLGVIRPR